MNLVSNHYFLVVGIKIETFWISVIYSDPTGPTQKKPFSPLGIVFFFFFFYTIVGSTFKLLTSSSWGR